MLDAEAGSARVELGVLAVGPPCSRIASLVLAGTDFGDTAGEEAAEALASREDVIYDFSCAERVEYFAMLRWQLSIELVDCSSLLPVSLSVESSTMEGGWNTLTLWEGVKTVLRYAVICSIAAAS